MQGILFIFLATIIYQVLSACRPTDIIFIDFQDKPKRSVKFTVTAKATKCPGENELYYEWKVQEKPSAKIVQTSRKPFIKIDGYEYNSNVVFKIVYILALRLSHNANMSSFGSKTMEIQFIPDEMIVKITGGPEITHEAGKYLKVNAKDDSKDPSYPPFEDNFVGDKIVWYTEPDLEGLSSDNLIFKVPGRLLKANNKYKFTITITRTKIPKYFDEKSASQIVHVLAKQTTKIYIKCIRNCVYPHPREITVLKVICSYGCHGLLYKWTTNPAVDSSKKEFGDTYDKILVHADVFRYGQKVSFTVRTGTTETSYTLKFIKKFTKGNCRIFPQQGISGTTKFNIKCEGFISPVGGIMYIIYQKSGNSKGEGVILNEDMTVEENNVYLSEGSPAIVSVKILDTAFMEEEVELTATVKPFSEGLHNATELNSLKHLILNVEPAISVTDENSRNRVVQIISFVLDALQKIENVSDSVKMDLYKHMAESLNALTLDNFSSALQMVLILKKLQKLKLATDTITSKLIGKSLMNAAVALHVILKESNNRAIPSFFIRHFIENVFELSSDLLKENADLEETLEHLVEVHDYDSYDDLDPKKTQVRSDLRDTFESILISVQILGISALRPNEVDEKALLFENKSITLMTRRVTLKSLANQFLTLPKIDSKIYISASLTEELNQTYEFIDFQFGVFRNKPFWWDSNSSYLNTDFIIFDFFKSSNRLTTIKNPIEIHLKAIKIPQEEFKGIINNNWYNNIAVHRVKVNPDSVVMVVFRPSTENYKVVAVNEYCKIEDFSKGILIQPSSSENESTLIVQSNQSMAIYVCVLKMGNSTVEYAGTFSSFSCVYWNLKTGNWQSRECRIRKVLLQNENLIHCECTHLSFFTGKIFIPPNQINLNENIDFSIAIFQNWLMVVIVVGLLLVWLVLLFWAFLADKKLMKKNFICKLEDNISGDSHVYLLVVFTGVFIDAGTTADVGFQLIGSKTSSRVHIIRCSCVKMLKRDSQDWFIVYTPKDLGKVKKIRIWHNCKGNRPHWYCQRIIVQHLKSGEQFCFIVEKWFSLIWGNGKIYREILVQKEESLKSTRLLFSIKFKTQLKDKHLWLSIMTRDPQSNFNSKERVSTAVCVVFLTMLANSMFHGVPKGKPEDSIDSHGSYFITYYDLAVFIESWMISVPIGLCIVILFRNSAPQK